MNQQFKTNTPKGQLSVTQTNVEGLEPSSAIYDLDNRTIESFVAWTFNRVNVDVSVALVDLASRNPRGGSKEINIGIVVYFKQSDFLAQGGNKFNNISPLLENMLSENLTYQPTPDIGKILESCILTVNGKPDKFLNIPATASTPAQISVRLDPHRVIRMILAAPSQNYVVTIIEAASRDNGEEVVLKVSKAIATHRGGGRRADSLHQRTAELYGGKMGNDFRGNNSRRPIR